TSNAPVFCPSIRNGFTELTSAIGFRSTSSRTSANAWSKLPRSATTRAPCMSACASLPVAILPSGTITAPRSPPRAAYAAALAEVARRRAEEVEPADQLHRSFEFGLEYWMEHHVEPRVVAEPLLDHRLHRHLLQSQDLGYLRQHPGAVGHLQVEVEGGLRIGH